MKHLSGSPLQSRLLTLPTNIRLGCKGLPGINTLAYCENPLITAVKSLIAQALACLKFNYFCLCHDDDYFGIFKL